MADPAPAPPPPFNALAAARDGTPLHELEARRAAAAAEVETSRRATRDAAFAEARTVPAFEPAPEPPFDAMRALRTGATWADIEARRRR